MMHNGHQSTSFEVLPFEYEEEMEGYFPGGRMQGELAAGSKEHVRWVQASLNRILGLRLAEDGQMGPATRSAIRGFQQKQGLAADGIVGKMTEAALEAALNGRPAAPVAPTAPAPAATGSQGQVIFGLDTYGYDGNKNPNWMKARDEAGVRFAIIKSNDGVWPDPAFKREWPRIREAGLVRGAYLFLRFPHPKYKMQAPDAAAQANKLIQLVGPLEKTDLPPTIDIEFPGSRKVTGLTAQQCLDRVRTAWKVLKGHYGVAPIIYTSARVWQEDLNNLAAPELVESPLWLAKPWPYKLQSKAVYNPAIFAGGRLDPKVPPPWGDATNWWIHQYQGDARALPGFFQVDMNRFNPMQKGAAGARVQWVQRRLGLPQTGRFDDAMESALRAFQKRSGLAASGSVDQQTFTALCWSNPL